jgi:hypothetical protein
VQEKLKEAIYTKQLLGKKNIPQLGERSKPCSLQRFGKKAVRSAWCNLYPTSKALVS